MHVSTFLRYFSLFFCLNCFYFGDSLILVELQSSKGDKEETGIRVQCTCKESSVFVIRGLLCFLYDIELVAAGEQ